MGINVKPPRHRLSFCVAFFLSLLSNIRNPENVDQQLFSVTLKVNLEKLSIQAAKLQDSKLNF